MINLSSKFQLNSTIYFSKLEVKMSNKVGATKVGKLFYGLLYLNPVTCFDNCI